MIHEVLRTVPNIGYSVSFTTRDIREGEVNGTHYNFVTREEFENLIAAGELLEHANVHGNYYGTSKKQVEKETSEGKDIILEIDVQGAEAIRLKAPEAVSIFILPPSYEVLKDRLTSRNTESETMLNIRLGNAKGEVARYLEFDYVIVNSEVEKAVVDLQSVVYAERCRRERQSEKLEKIIRTFDNN